MRIFLVCANGEGEMHVRQDIDFLNLVQRVQYLLDCEAACLVLDCPFPALRHPLLDLIPSGLPSSHRYYGSTALTALLDEEPVRALIDIAIQTGQVQSGNDCQIRLPGVDVQSFAVVPVEQPAGVPGYFLLANPLFGAFAQGEHRVLNDYRPSCTPALERAIRNLCARFFDFPYTHDLLQIPIAEVSQHNQAEQAKNEYVSMISHELRTPLTAIKGYAGLLQAYSVPQGFEKQYQAEMTPVRQRQYLDVIMEQINHLEVLIGDLLDISRLEAGRLALHFTEVDMALLCQRVIRLAQDSVDQRQPGKYQIRCSVDDDLPLAWADPDRVEQVLNNLLDNAIKYSPDGGVIEIRAFTRKAPSLFHSEEEQNVPESQSQRIIPLVQEAKMLHITVRDHGIGIPNQQYAQLFKPYSRLEDATKEHIPGVGLGLYITRKLVQAMHGEMILESDEREGTRMTFTLLVADANKIFLPQTDFATFSRGEKSLVTSK